LGRQRQRSDVRDNAGAAPYRDGNEALSDADPEHWGTPVIVERRNSSGLPGESLAALPARPSAQTVFAKMRAMRNTG